MADRLTSLTDFVPLQKLGTGSFSTVYKVRRVSDSKIYALKKIKMSNLKEKEKENAVNQIRILASLSSPYIIGYKEALFEQKHNVLCIVMEYADGGDLNKLIEKTLQKKQTIKQKQIWKAIVHILKGLQTLHNQNILHRDLKSANVFVLSNQYKLGDLNVSKVKKGHMAYTQTGTPYYASPQVWNDKPYDHKSDIWSFGCIIYQMCCLKPPFQGRNMQELNKNIQRCKFGRIPSCYSKNLQDLINICLQKNPFYRLSAQQLLKNKLILPYLRQYTCQQDPYTQSQLLGTIRVPMNPKQFHLNLPKPKYEIQNQQQHVVTQPKQKPQLQNYLITPQKPKIKLSEVISENKSKIKSDRIMIYHNVINDSLEKDKSKKQVIKNIINNYESIQSLEIQALKMRPIISLPKTQRPSHCKSVNKHNLSQDYLITPSEQSAQKIQSIIVQTCSQKKSSALQKQSIPKYNSANKCTEKPQNKLINNKSSNTQRKQRDVSPILRRLELNQHINRSQEIRSRFMQISDRKPVLNRLQQKLQKYYNPRKITSKKYNVMPSWW